MAWHSWISPSAWTRRARKHERSVLARSSRPATALAETAQTDPAVPAVAFEHVSLAFDDHVVLRDLGFVVRRGHMTLLIGASGAGKSVILKLILGLLKPGAGIVRVDGDDITDMDERQLMTVRDDIGMLFQENALFDSLTVAENVGYKLTENGVPDHEVRRRVEEVLGFIGLREHIERMPSELSGGQRRRVAIARAMAPRPHLLLFDDPTAGLDPITAKTVDAEIIKLRDIEGVTSIVVTHQLQDAFYIATHEAVPSNEGLAIVAADSRKCQEADFVMLRDGRVYFEGHAGELCRSNDPYIHTFLTGWYPPLTA